MLELIVSTAHAGHRLDRFLAGELAHLSRSRVQALIRSGHVLLNRRVVKPGEALRPEDVISWEEPPAAPTEIAAESIALSVLYEDDDLLVLNKAPGMVTHPAPGNDEGTLVNALLAHCETLSGIGGERRPGIVHRLDKDTSGCLVVAKNDFAHRALSEQFASRTTLKRYLAIVSGRPSHANGLIDAPIGRHPVHRKKMAVVPPPRGRSAQTEYRVRRELTPLTGGKSAKRPLSLIECRLLTGRTHQIRVHLKTIGCSILGDGLYGAGEEEGAARQLLHAWKLGFVHPRTGEARDFCAPPPADFLAFGLHPEQL
jgi:23S rRNA pseudouridine1911/1915/1917 synthase